MKYLFKYLVKLIFVAVIPIVMTVILVNLFFTMDWSPTMIAIVAIVTILTYVNAMFYSMHMNKTYLLPRMRISTRPGIGLDIEKVLRHWELRLPLLTVIFQRRK